MDLYKRVVAYKQTESYKQIMIQEYDRKFGELCDNIFHAFFYTFFNMIFATIAAKYEYRKMETFYISGMCFMFLWMLYNIYNCIKLCCRGKY
jgi:hypothetical protein